MKRNLSLIVFIFMFLTSCSDNADLQAMRSEVESLKNEVRALTDSLETVQRDIVEPMERYQEIVLSEPQTAPDVLIEQYNNLIELYPNSIWAHDSKKRIENIEKRRNCWSEEGGWNLKAEENVIIDDTKIISCPGC